jgi:hypothetical protein
MEQANLNYINDLSGDSLDFKAKLISIIKIELPDEIGVYFGYKAKGDFARMAESVHKLKHKISILGLEKSYYIAEDYENNLKKNSTDLRSNFESILEYMQEFVNLL